jgi:5-methylcytosine-specific restriction enzyme subunit McrC
MSPIELQEETDLYLPPNALEHETALAIHRDPHFDIEWPNPGNEFRFRLRSKGWIGHIPAGNTLLIVQPKVSVTSIFGMLEVAYNLKSFNILEGESAVTSLEDIYERIASILAKRVNDRIRKGLYRSYIERDDDLEYVRGRIDIRGNIRNAVLGAPRLHCNYQELTADLEENVILLWALYAASRLGLQRDDVKLQVRRAYRGLLGSVSLEQKTVHDCIGRFYHRLNDDYRPMHGLCRFLIEHSGPGTERGEREFLPFCLNMPNLFEAFVAEWLKENLPERFKVDTQYHARITANADLSFQIDLVLRNRADGSPIAVLDTKYKLGELPSESDIQQVIAYAVRLGVTKAYLIYPFEIHDPIHAKIGNVEVRTFGFSLENGIAVAGAALIKLILPSDFS